MELPALHANGPFACKMGFAVRNFFVPEDIALHSADQDCVVAVEAKAGDMVIFLCAPTTPFSFHMTARFLLTAHFPRLRMVRLVVQRGYDPRLAALGGGLHAALADVLLRPDAHGTRATGVLRRHGAL